ncbi:MAG: hypothetical protein IKJ26_02145 [Clostridia bacterium]|nr:hypothetical protein [Clostridia bacterium]
MLVTTKISSDKFSLAFDGENEIDASLLGNALSNLSFVVSKIVDDDPSSPEYQLKVQSFSKGSFVVDLSFILVLAAQTVSMAGISSLEDAANLFDIIVGMFDIKSKLKGEKPQEVKEDINNGHVQVIAPDGTEVVAPLGSRIVISNPAVEKSICAIAESMHLHNPNGGIRLTRGDETRNFNSEQIQDIAIPSHIPEYTNTDSIQTKRISLPIKKLDLLGNGAWNFRYGKRAISASINDPDFLKTVHEGRMSYKAGDKLDVELLIETKIAPDNTPIGETYSIEKVYGVIPAPEQQRV